jgi:hypothetical protein
MNDLEILIGNKNIEIEQLHNRLKQAEKIIKKMVLGERLAQVVNLRYNKYNHK